MNTEINLTYSIVSSYTDTNSSKEVPPLVKTTFDIQIPESIWKKYKDNEEKLLEWAIDIALIPSLVNSFNQRHGTKSK